MHQIESNTCLIPNSSKEIITPLTSKIKKIEFQQIPKNNHESYIVQEIDNEGTEKII